MELIVIVISLALIEYIIFGMLVGKARGDYNIEAPATSGHPVFERYYRVQENTLELLIYFIPGILMFAHYWRDDIAAGLGVVFLVGRLIYLKEYVSEPKTRTLGFVLSFLPAVTLVIGGLVGAVMALI